MHPPEQPDRPPRGPLGPPGRRAAERAAGRGPGGGQGGQAGDRPGSRPEPSRHDASSAPTERGTWPPPGTYPPGTHPPGTYPPGAGSPGAPPPRTTPVPEGVPSPRTMIARGTQKAVQQVRKITQAQGMGRSGLYKLLEMNAFNAAGDAAMAIGLAGTMFFAVPSGEARGRIALTLLITMLPFAVVAPLIGPFLDRFRHARRWAIGSTLAIRAFFCWMLADAVSASSIWLYPLALGCLIAGRAHGIARASAMPRLLPPGLELVTANSRIYLSGIVGTAIAGIIGGGLAFFGAEWVLRFAFVVYVIGTILAIRLPAQVDSAADEGTVGIGDVGRTLRGVPTRVVLALRANAAFRALTGFLIMFMAFLLREQPLPGIPLGLQIGVIAAAAGGGNVVGTSLGALAEARRPEVIVQALLAASVVVAALSAAFYGLIAIAAIGLIAGFAQQLGKLSLDALIQHEVPEHVRNSVFARSETVLQLAWVLGGVLGIVMPLIPQLGLGVAAAGLLLGLVSVRRTARAVTR